jgi:5-guanidino-2-oxopentanoate decarboxylase
MADGYARASGRPGVCTLISGPGLTNALTPIGQAYSDSIPMLVVSSVNASRELGRGWGCLHEIRDQAATAAQLVGLSRTAFNAEEVASYLLEAFTLFASARPRPVHLQLPIDVLGAQSDVDDTAPGPVPMPPRATAHDIERAARLLLGADRPLIVVGGGAIAAHECVGALAEALSSPVILTVAGKGIIPDRHPMSLGASLSSALTRALLREADVVLALGTELSETDHWTDKLDIPGRLIRIDLDPRKLCDLYRAELPLIGEAGAAVRDLLSAVSKRRRPLWGGDAAGRVAAIRASLDEERRTNRPEYQRALNALRLALPADGLVASDMTQLAYAANGGFPVDRPRSYLHPCGFGALGYGLPAAIGAKLGAPERPVISIVGDGGLLFTMTELATAVELGLPLPIVLWDNDGLGQIRDDMIHKQIPQIGVSPRNPDFIAVARGFGAAAFEVEGPDHIGPLLRTALNRPGPTVLRLHADRFK